MTNRIPLIVNAGAAQIQEVAASDTLQVPGNLTANVVQSDNYQYANGTPISFAGTYGNANVAAYLPTYTGNLNSVNILQANIITANANITATNILTDTETVNGNLRAGNVSSVGNVIAAGVKTDNYMYANGTPFVSSNYGNSNVEALLSSGAFTGNIIPNGNATQSLGNATHQWKDLWVSNATIYINSIPLGVGNTGVLQFDGNDIVTSGPNVVNTGNVETSGDVIGGNLVIATGGTLQFPDGSFQGTAFVGDATRLYNGNAALTLESDGSLLPSSNLTPSNFIVNNATPDVDLRNSSGTGSFTQGATEYVIRVAGTNNLTLDNTGTLTAPGNITTTGDVSAANITSSGLTTIGDLYSPNFYANAVTYANATGYLTSTNLFKYDPGTQILTVGSVSATGNIAGEGGNISNITGANVTGEVAVANVVSNPTQSNITQVGALQSLEITGQLTANGNAQFNADVYFAGNVTIPGNINQISGNSGQFFGNAVTGFGAFYGGLPAGYTLLNNEVAQFADNYNGYTQVTHQNINGGDQATGDFVITANNGTDFINHIDLGIAGSGYNGLLANNSLGTALYPNDGYLYTRGNVSGGNLILGSNQANGVVRIIANGASNIGDVVATFSANGLSAVAFTGNGAGVANVDAITLQGAAPNTASSVNTIVQRDSSGRVSASGFNTAGTYLGEGNVYTESWLVANNMGVDTYQLNVGADANITGNLSASYAVFNDIVLNDLSANSILYTDANRNVWNTDFSYNVDNNTMSGGNISLTGNITSTNSYVTFASATTVATNTIMSSNGATDIYIDPMLQGLAFIQVPTFTDGGEQLVINNHFNSSNGIVLVTETGSFHFAGNSLTYPDATVQSTAWTGSVNNITNTGNTFAIAANGVMSLSDTGQTYLTMDKFGITANTQFSLSAENAVTGNNSTIQLSKDGQGITLKLETNVPSQALWTFYPGNLTFPDGTHQTTAFTGAGSYGDSNVSTYLASGNNSAGYSTTGNVTAATFVTPGVSGNIQGANYISANYFVGDGSLLTNLPAVSASIGTLVSGPNATPTVNNTQYNVTALAVSMNVDAPTGVPADAHKLTFRIIDNGTPQTLSWDPIYQVIGVTLPTTTVANKYVYVGCIYNAQDTTWDVVSVAQQA